MILNLGSGRAPSFGAINVDRHGSPGVQAVADLQRLPFRDSIADIVIASHVLEHVKDFEQTMAEIHRVLKPGGYLIARVPYGMRSLYNPFHRRPFKEVSIHHLVIPSTDLERQGSWSLISMEARRHPQWHLGFYLNVPFGRKSELLFTLEAKK